MSMDRKNKKDAQREAKGERPDGANAGRPVNASPQHQQSPQPQYQQQEPIATPVPIRSALSSSLASPPAHRMPSSPLREPFGPPPHSGGSPGFGRPSPSGNLHGFASSPSRPSPLSSSFNGTRGSVPAPAALSLKSPLRPPITAFSSSFSHTTLSPDHRPAPLSASFADNSMMRKSIWARSEQPAEPLSPRNRPILPQSQSHPLFHVRKLTGSGDVFLDDEDDEHGQDLLPSSLIDDVLLPTERARRLSRRDSQESHSASPSRHAFGVHAGWVGGERLAQSAGPTPGFLQNLWSADGIDSRKTENGSQNQNSNLNVGTPTYSTRTSLLTQQRSPQSQGGYESTNAQIDGSFLIRGFGGPSSPSARALMEHEPGMSLPSGVAGALSRLHLQGSGLRREGGEGEIEGEGRVPGPGSGMGRGREEVDDEGIFSMDG
jgi:cleavage and polyadenylation specificity factor subunit 4